MNTPNNKRRKDSQKRIETAFIKLLQDKELNAITVTDICKLAQVNRTTFYANYLDIYDLADAVQSNLEKEVAELYSEEHVSQFKNYNFLKLFQHIRDNQIFYSTYFKLDIDGRLNLAEYDIYQAEKLYGNKHIEYHIEFFRSGLNAVIKKWLAGGCKESPEEINEIITAEYNPKALYLQDR